MTSLPEYDEALTMSIYQPEPGETRELSDDLVMKLSDHRDGGGYMVGTDKLDLDVMADDGEGNEDNSAPRVTSTEPANGATSVSTRTTVKAVFSEPTGEARLVLKDSQGNQVAGTGALDGDSKVLTFQPDQPLVAGATYSAEVSGGVDASDNTMEPHTWTFSTDGTPPTVAATSPVQGATSVALNEPIRATFSEPVSDARFVVKDSDGAEIPGAVSVDDTNIIWTVTPATPLRWNGAYTVQVSGAKDVSGNLMAPHAWSFATVTDHAAPSVTEIVPARDAVDVAVRSPVRVSFDEPVSDTRITVKDPAGVEISGHTVADQAGKVWAFTPGVPLNTETVFTVEVAGAKDGANNVMNAYSWSFTTAQPDTTPPAVSGTSPANDALGVALAAPVRATFSEPVTAGMITVKDPAGIAVAGTTVMESETLLSFTPAAPFAGLTKYTVEVSGAKDASDNAMASFSWSFTTLDPPPPANSPRVSSEYVSPSGDETGATTSSLTPRFYGVVEDPEGRSSTFTVEVEHDPANTSQGTGAIWSGTSTTATANGAYASIAIPSGKLSDGWKVRWRARATAGGVNGAWTSWHGLIVDTSSGGGGCPLLCPALKSEQAASAAESAAANPASFLYDHMTVKECQETPPILGAYQPGMARIQERPYSSCWSAYIYIEGFEDGPDGRKRKKAGSAFKSLWGAVLTDIADQLNDDDALRFRMTWVINSHLGNSLGTVAVGSTVEPQDVIMLSRLDKFAFVTKDGQVREDLLDDLDDLEIQYGVNPVSLYNKSSCLTHSDPPIRKRTVAQWRAMATDDVMRFDTQDWERDKLATCTLNPTIDQIGDDTAAALPLWSQDVLNENGKKLSVVRKGMRLAPDVIRGRIYAPSFRCDWMAFGILSDPYNMVEDHIGGCINSRAARVFEMSRSRDANFRQVIDHIAAALHPTDNTWTYPPFREGESYEKTNPPKRTFDNTEDPKKIPGNWNAPTGTIAGEPLNRVKSKEDKDKNRDRFSGFVYTAEGVNYNTRPLNYCRYYYDTLYANPAYIATVDPRYKELQCDEYPFASTVQGAANEDYNYSLRAVGREHNGRHGSALNSFYSRYRVGSGNSFWVSIVP